MAHVSITHKVWHLIAMLKGPGSKHLLQLLLVVQVIHLTASFPSLLHFDTVRLRQVPSSQATCMSHKASSLDALERSSRDHVATCLHMSCRSSILFAATTRGGETLTLLPEIALPPPANSHVYRYWRRSDAHDRPLPKCSSEQLMKYQG